MLARAGSNRDTDAVWRVRQEVRANPVVQVFLFRLLPSQLGHVPFLAHADGGGQVPRKGRTG